MFGYFSDNELAWWGRGQQQTGLFDAAMKFDASHTAKQALVNLVKQKAGGGIEQFNAVWNTKCGSFDDVIKLKQLPSASEAQIQIKHDFLRLVAERYFSVTTRIIREVDPSHMVLGARFAGTGGADPAVWEITGKYCDVVTFNCYPKADLDEGIVYSGFGVDAEPVTEHFAKYYEYVKKPMLITEWSFPALDAGVPSVHGAGQRFFTQTGRTAATKLFAQTMLSLPYLIGYDYFMWVDEPALGISTPFPEDSNYGLVNEDNVPYPQITGMFAELHGDLWNQRTSPVPPVRTAVKKRVLSPMESVLKLKEDTTGEVQVSADEKRYVIENGRLKLEGRIGGRIFENVSLDGVLFGSYTAMLHILDVKGENQWREIQRVTAFSSRMERGCAVLDVTGEHKGVPDFETTHRILIAPGSTKFICELVCIKNTGTGKLPVKAAYFRFNGADKEWDVSSFPPNLWGVPESSCWMHPEKGAYYGALASRRSPGIRIHFWKDPNHNSFHPDARFEMDRILEPGALFRPDEPVFVVGLCGTGGRAAWLEDLKNGGALLETIQ
jgi:hypothetical protein